MDYKLLLDKIEAQYNNELPFVLYCLPNDEKLTCYFQKDTELYTVNNFSEKGVKLSPFNSKEPILCISEQNSEVVETKYNIEKLNREETTITESKLEQSSHKRLVAKAIKSIDGKLASKIVVSRCKKIEINQFDFPTIISRLLNLYPEAFNYVWYHPKTGLWLGATPELLIKTNGIAFTTMALAGTKKIEDNLKPDWTLKEIMEQQYVTDAIAASLQKVTSVIKLSKTYTHNAGSVAHLRTDISGALKNGKATLDIIASSLHPTPAVCGTPREYSKEFIEKNEGYDREFYTGFVGPVDQRKASSQLYVNLRCMKIQDNIANLYVGSGITSSSNPEAEWIETHNKLQTMLEVLNPFII